MRFLICAIICSVGLTFSNYLSRSDYCCLSGVTAGLFVGIMYICGYKDGRDWEKEKKEEQEPQVGKIRKETL